MLPISALQHLLFCERQCALIHLERVWAENQFTAEGQLLHKKAHSDEHESRPSIRITRSLPISSEQLGIFGQCDIVEFHKDGKIIPIEYKRGKPKSHRADEVQLCAQALCLEEMLSVKIPQAFLFYGKNKRRTHVALDEKLRTLTQDTIQNLHTLIDSKKTPPAHYETRKCDACSLIDHCQPQAFHLKRSTASWFLKQLAVNNQQEIT
ncbi:MAG: CRISPR-associated protein Cas4 [Chthoniobacterales bacterium]